MKQLQFLLATLVAAACLVLAIMTVTTSRANVRKQQELAAVNGQIQQINVAVQQEVRSLTGTEQVSRDVLTELGNSALKNEKIRAMLAKHGYTLSTNAPANADAGLPVVTTTTNPPAVTPEAVVPAATPDVKPKNEVVTPSVSVQVEPDASAKKEEKP